MRREERRQSDATAKHHLLKSSNTSSIQNSTLLKVMERRVMEQRKQDRGSWAESTAQVTGTVHEIPLSQQTSVFWAQSRTFWEVLKLLSHEKAPMRKTLDF